MFSAKPIRTMEDFRRAKPWAGPGDPVLTEMFRAANVSTMVVPVSDVLTALQTGLIQTVYSPPLACVAIQWFTKVKYRIDLRLMYSLGGVFVTKSSWERIPTDLRATTLELCRRGVRDLSAGVRKSNDDSLKVMADNGIATVVPPPEAVADFEGVSRRAAAALRGPDYPVEAETLLNRYLAEYRGKGGTKPDAP
jgi:TRAP-type C4-dicarboxylate transport system substrate-binding protein